MDAIQIFNNPVRSGETVKVYIPQWEMETAAQVRIYSMTGKAMAQQKIVSPTTRIAVTNWAKGPYLLAIQYQDELKNELIIVQ